MTRRNMAQRKHIAIKTNVILGQFIFLLATSLLWHERLVTAQMPVLKSSFGLLGTTNYMGTFGKNVINQLLNEYRHRQMIKAHSEDIRNKIYQERLLSQVRSGIFRDFYNRF